jgi:peptide-methionine (S)-S-oxide reductase
MVTPERALPGRSVRAFAVPERHLVLGSRLEGPWEEPFEVIGFAMGCFWGAERIFWQLPGVISTAAGYQGGFTENPTYEESVTGLTGHAEAVQVVFDPRATSAELLLKAFWENHDPTQGFRQGNDRGTEYRSAVFTTTEDQARLARATRDAFQAELTKHGRGAVTTELKSAQEVGPFYYAEDYHQQYLEKNPSGYCNHGPNGLTCPVGLDLAG